MTGPCASRTCALLLVFCAIAGDHHILPAAQGAEDQRLNVLFIAVDDLRPDVGCYGQADVRSPNIDKLAAGGVVFTRAYCQQAVCSPSRTSLLLGRRPDTTKVYDLQTHFRKHLPDVVTLPEHFKRQGYHTQGLSKIFHGGLDDPPSWTLPHWTPAAPNYGKPETLAIVEANRRRMREQGAPEGKEVIERDPKTGTVLSYRKIGGRPMGPPWEDPDVPDNALADGKTADRAIEVLREVKDRRFFLAVGFLKPHLPFVAPKRYYDLYSPAAMPLAPNPYPPKDVPQIALTTWGELRNYHGMPKDGPLTDEQARALVRGYRAATSYVDAQIGRVLDELERLGLAERTVVVLWGDHGWQLGEHGLWCKHTNFEAATRSLLIIRTPGRKAAGAKSAALTEFVDVYPTLCDLCDLPLPDGLEGTSAAPLLDDPDRAWKKSAFSQYPRGKAMGYSMRTDRYRYTEWSEPGQPPAGVELYDHRTDPQENINLAGRPDMKPLVEQLSQQLHDGWKAAGPEKP